MSFSEDKFRDHIKQIIASQESDSDRPLTLPELKELAESMGVSEREWLALMMKAETSLNTALGHLKVDNYADAISMAEEATSINPYIKNGNAVLAQCYYKLGLVDKNAELFHKAEHFARMELKNDPLDSVALNVLSAVETIQKEGKFSGTLIRTIAMIAGATVLIFLLLYMCTDTLKEDRVRDIIQEETNGTDDQKLTNQKNEADKLEAVYLAAIERRNEIALELVGFIDDSKLKNAYTEAITDYDMKRIGKSEQRFKLALSDVKRNVSVPRELEVRLTGGENRINTAKMRYLKAVTMYNNTLESADPEGSFKKIDALD